MKQTFFTLSLWGIVCRILKKKMNLIHFEKVKHCEYFPDGLYIYVYIRINTNSHTLQPVATYPLAVSGAWSQSQLTLNLSLQSTDSDLHVCGFVEEAGEPRENPADTRRTSSSQKGCTNSVDHCSTVLPQTMRTI